jgi:hypothetical protein
MSWVRILCLVVFVGAVVHADELHLRDGTVIVGSYIGGTQKEVYFQRTPAGTDMFPLFMVESLKFNTVPTLTPGASSQSPKTNHPASFAQSLTSQLKWAFAILFPPTVTAQLAHPAR